MDERPPEPETDRSWTPEHLRVRFRRGGGFANDREALRWLRAIPDSYITEPECDGNSHSITVGCPDGDRTVHFEVGLQGPDLERAERTAIVDACNQLYRGLHRLDEEGG